MALPDYDTIGSMIVNRLGQFEQNELARQKSKNALIQNKYAEPEIQANIAGKKAETARQNELLKQPFAGRSIPGAGGEALGLEMLKDQYGEESPVYKNALNSYNLDQSKKNQLMNYQQALMETLPKRTASPLAKQQMEQSDIEQGFMPGTTAGGKGVPVSPEKQADLLNQNRLKLLKDVTDPKMRERALYAANMEKTINTLNPDALTIYSGPQGRLQMAEDIAQSTASKKDVPRYKAYKEALTSAKVLAKQVRQFYGDSITPQVQEQLAQLADPTTWYEQPDIAMARYNQFVNILGTEADTFFDALKTADIYKKPEKKTGGNLASEAAKITKQPEKSEGIMTYNPKTGRLE